MDNRVYGYARVSTREQNEDRQIEALTKFGVSEQNIIIDRLPVKILNVRAISILNGRYFVREIRLLSKSLAG